LRKRYTGYEKECNFYYFHCFYFVCCSNLSASLNTKVGFEWNALAPIESKILFLAPLARKRL
jgi:hypothetical protein